MMKITFSYTINVNAANVHVKSYSEFVILSYILQRTDLYRILR